MSTIDERSLLIQAWERMTETKWISFRHTITDMLPIILSISTLLFLWGIGLFLLDFLATTDIRNVIQATIAIIYYVGSLGIVMYSWNFGEVWQQRIWRKTNMIAKAKELLKGKN